MGKRKKKRGMKVGCSEFESVVDDVRDLALDHELSVEQRRVEGRGTCRDTLHVMFKAGSLVVLHYWPGNGKVWSPLTNEKKVVRDAYEALDEAGRINGMRYWHKPMAIREQEAHLDSIVGR